ncbi:hypothetical protein AXF42_Ash014498 [Apostasia shenzhenica]|uniref:Uncharacterized protein n=1 Tax=Apostasia shenzhenica TaxID=1088818 RepID=A0A2H9ZWN6_9ASPA|nr:hypothetical protein AXF42_Ash014498 [Apostasia shenzhenica]
MDSARRSRRGIHLARRSSRIHALARQRWRDQDLKPTRPPPGSARRARRASWRTARRSALRANQRAEEEKPDPKLGLVILLLKDNYILVLVFQLHYK